MKGWKTVAFGVLVAALGALSDTDMQSWVLENFEWTAGGLGTIIVILRALTTSSIFKKEA